MSGLSLFTIPNDDSYEQLLLRRFKLVRDCGSNIQGLLLSLGVSYIDNMILSQNTIYNNYMFIDALYLLFSITRLKESNELPLIVLIFADICNKSASHDEFAKACKVNIELITSILEFAKRLFLYQENDTEQDLLIKLDLVSTELNIQISIYDSNGQWKLIKKNRFINPIILSIFCIFEEDQNMYFALYHENYKFIDPNNFNSSIEFFPDEEYVGVSYFLEKIAEELIDEIKNIELLDSEKIGLQENINQLKNVSQKGIEYERLLNNILS